MIFSVVIPLYNKGRFIEMTLASVLAQTCQDYEIIVVDDGSTDGGAQIAASFLRNRQHVHVIRQANAGVSAARNKGIAMATGRWVAFLDADDYWHPDYLATQMAVANSHPHVNMLATNLRTLPDAPDWTPHAWPEQNTTGDLELIDDLPHRWFQGLPFITSSVAVRATTLRRMQPCFPVGESNGEDLDLWFRLSESTSIARSSRVLLTYREAPEGGLTSRNSIHAEAPYLQRMLQRAQRTPMSRRKQTALVYFVGQQRVSNARRHLESGEKMNALALLAKAWPVMFSRRWLGTLLMTIAIPRGLVRRWNQWRYLRKAIHG